MGVIKGWPKYLKARYEFSEVRVELWKGQLESLRVVLSWHDEGFLVLEK